MSGINRFTASDREPNFIQDQLSEEDAGLSISGNFGADSHLLHDYKEKSSIVSTTNRIIPSPSHPFFFLQEQ